MPRRPFFGVFSPTIPSLPMNSCEIASIASIYSLTSPSIHLSILYRLFWCFSNASTKMTDLVHWTAPAGCVAHHVALIERHVNAQPPQWREVPVIGEVFANKREGEARLQLYALIIGFDVVVKGGGNAATPGVVFRCIHHSKATKNSRGLKDRVEHDLKGNITSQRKREGTKVR